MARTLVGIDGCTAGWLCVRNRNDHIDAWISPTFNDVLERAGADALIGIDIPIGLPMTGSRACDKEARSLLGWPRRNSVFPAPIRGVIELRDYAAACEAHRRTDGRAVTKQAFALFGKIREIDESLQKKVELRQQVHEVHPEASFAFMNGGSPMLHRKSSLAGRHERSALIERTVCPSPLQIGRSLQTHLFKPDDLLDAFVALWSVDRHSRGDAKVLGGEHDETGLAMKIVA